MKIVELLHSITQKGYEIYFSDDFEGMITITYKESVSPGTSDGYIRHEHLSYPSGSMKELDKEVIRSLSQFYSEVETGKPRKDGLAQ